MIATDHAPHSAEEKAKGLEGSLMGIVGLETAFPLLYTYLVRRGTMTLQRLIELLCDQPRRRFALGENGWTLFDLAAEYRIDPEQFQSKGRSTPFAGWLVQGRCLLTQSEGKIAWRDTAYLETVK